MLYPFMTLDDETEIVHSETLSDGRVKVYIEKPDEKDCFHSATCYLPKYEWENIEGFTDEEIEKYQEIIESLAHLIIEFAADGGFENTRIFKVGSYWVYFWTNENTPLEPVHVYVSKGKPTENATKIWITKSGRVLLCNNNSHIPDKNLRNIKRVVDARSKEIIQKWYDTFNQIDYYC